MKWLQILLISIGASCAGVAQSEEQGALSPAQARVLIQEWMKTERLISEEKKDWAIKQENLQQLIKLYQTEVALIREELDAAGEATKNFDEQTEALKLRVAEFKQERRKLAEKVEQQRQRLITISASFPVPLLKQIETSLLDLKSADVELRETVIAMLNVVKTSAQFNRVVTYSEEMQTVGETGEKRQLRVLYLGLGRAYFLSGETAGVGTPAKGGWKWAVDDSLEPTMAKAIAVYEKTARPELVNLPVEVQK